VNRLLRCMVALDGSMRLRRSEFEPTISLRGGRANNKIHLMIYRQSKRLALGLATVAVLILAAWVFFLGEAEFSLSKISWHRNFNQAIEKNNEVKLGDLVDFKWDRIYFLEAYDVLTPPQEMNLFPRGNNLDSISWYGNTRYWTIAYQRPNKPPFLIRMHQREWHARNGTNLLTVDPDAKLRRVQKGTIEFTWCSPKYDPDRCLALDDIRSSAPTVKRH
jgi:hypothetical protein